MVEANATVILRGGKICIDLNGGNMVTSSNLEKTEESSVASMVIHVLRTQSLYLETDCWTSLALDLSGTIDGLP